MRQAVETRALLVDGLGEGEGIEAGAERGTLGDLPGIGIWRRQHAFRTSVTDGRKRCWKSRRAWRDRRVHGLQRRRGVVAAVAHAPADGGPVLLRPMGVVVLLGPGGRA